MYNIGGYPHTRGSTLIEEERVPYATGYPAYAGIDRVLGKEQGRRDELPPHTRGSTLRSSCEWV